MPVEFTPAVGFGGLLEIDTTYPAGPTYTDVGAVIDFGTNFDIEETDVTHQQTQPSPPYWKSFTSGGVGLEITFSVRFDPGVTEHEDTLLDELNIVRQFRYTFKDGSVWTFVGFYKTANISVPMDDALGADITVRVTGKPTFAGAA